VGQVHRRLLQQGDRRQQPVQRHQGAPGGGAAQAAAPHPAWQSTPHSNAFTPRIQPAKLKHPSTEPNPTPQGTYNTLKKLVETKWAESDGRPKPKVAWVTTNATGVSFRLDPYKITLIEVG
jgi:hypothetical protein